MDANPWDVWLNGNVLLEAQLDSVGMFSSDEHRAQWRKRQDAQSNLYQRNYAARRKELEKQDLPWWDTYVSKSELTWDYLGELEHPMDAHIELEE